MNVDNINYSDLKWCTSYSTFTVVFKPDSSRSFIYVIRWQFLGISIDLYNTWSAVASLGEADRRPGDTLRGVSARAKKIIFVGEFTKNSRQTRSDRWKRCRVTPFRKEGGWHPIEINKSDSDEQKRSPVLEKKINRVDMHCRSERWWWLKMVVSFFSGKKYDWQHKLPPRVTPTLVTPLMDWHNYCTTTIGKIHYIWSPTCLRRAAHVTKWQKTALARSFLAQRV